MAMKPVRPAQRTAGRVPIVVAMVPAAMMKTVDAVPRIAGCAIPVVTGVVKARKTAHPVRRTAGCVIPAETRSVTETNPVRTVPWTVDSANAAGTTNARPLNPARTVPAIVACVTPVAMGSVGPPTEKTACPAPPTAMCVQPVATESAKKVMRPALLARKIVAAAKAAATEFAIMGKTAPVVSKTAASAPYVEMTCARKTNLKPA